MIKPASLWAMLKTADANTISRVCMSLAGREDELHDPLNAAETTLAAVIRQDSEWMDERLDERKARDRARKAAYRMQKAECPTDSDVSHGIRRTDGISRKDECPTPSIHPSIHPSVHPSVRPVPNGTNEEREREALARAEGPFGSREVAEERPSPPSPPPDVHDVPSRPSNEGVPLAHAGNTVLPSAEEQKVYAHQIGVPDWYLQEFMSDMQGRGFSYVNRGGSTVTLNRRNFKAVLGSFWSQRRKTVGDEPTATGDGTDDPGGLKAYEEMMRSIREIVDVRS